ncbi:hypothetical protein MNV49_001850 [Pseudohyphozyma bogoriensis]|nr:hypothetical protein MNV49_001850 [Pseudohyphozyma bogoriensis]
MGLRKTTYEEMLPSIMKYPNASQPSLSSQLMDDVEYITTLNYGGQSNQFIEIQNRMDRVAIISPISGMWLPTTGINFSQIYDLPRLYSTTTIRAVSLSSFKTRFGPHNIAEQLQCWSTSEQYLGYPNNFQHRRYKLATSYWAFPPLPRLPKFNTFLMDPVIGFLSNRTAQEEWLDKVKNEWLPQGGKNLDEKEKNVKGGFDPTSQLSPLNSRVTCLDNMFYMSSEDHAIDSFVSDTTSPEWVEVGQHLHFVPRILELRDAYARRIFGTAEEEEAPPYISVHIRRGDFSRFKNNSLVPLSVYQSAVANIDRQLRDRAKMRNKWYHPSAPLPGPHEVLVTTDEPSSSKFVDEIRELGWKVVDHNALNTTATLGDWYGPALDSALLAGGRGFVGTALSTYSWLAKLRVESWNDGIVIIAQKNGD